MVKSNSIIKGGNDIYTSYFANTRHVSNTVAICTGVPEWYKGEIYPALAPGWDIVMEYKQAVRDGKPINEIIDNYIKRYENEILFYLDPEEIYNDLKDKILLCYEKPSDFCHRHLVRKWLNQNLNLNIQEAEAFEDFKVIIAGGRDFNDYETLKQTCDFYLSQTQKRITIISGKAKGADTLGERYAQERGFKISAYPADWDQFGKSAGFIRNKQMAEEADALIAFWDGASKGTASMIDLANKKNLIVAVEHY